MKPGKAAKKAAKARVSFINPVLREAMLSRARRAEQRTQRLEAEYYAAKTTAGGGSGKKRTAELAEREAYLNELRRQGHPLAHRMDAGG